MGAIRVKMFSGEIEDIDKQIYDFLEVEPIPPSHFIELKLWDLSEHFQAAIVYEMPEVEYVEPPWARLEK